MGIFQDSDSPSSPLCQIHFLYIYLIKHFAFCGSENGGCLIFTNMLSGESEHFKKKNAGIDGRFTFLNACITFKKKFVTMISNGYHLVIMSLKGKMHFILHRVTSLDLGFPKKITSPQPQTFWPVILGMAQPLGITLHIKVHFTKVPILYFWKSTFWRVPRTKGNSRNSQERNSLKGDDSVWTVYVRSKDRLKKFGVLTRKKERNRL